MLCLEHKIQDRPRYLRATGRAASSRGRRLALGASNPHFVAKNKTVDRAGHRIADVIST
jgi:hypothetical protein